MKIVHLTHSQIDKLQWDDFMEQTHNGLIYGLSWFLDIVSPQWEALVSDDFRYIMPIPVKRKYGIKYVVQHSFAQQLGIFSTEEINTDIVSLFRKNIPAYSYEMSLNYENYHPAAIPFKNYLLSFDDSYAEIRSAYSKNTIRNIEGAKKNNLEIIDDLTTTAFIAFNDSVSKSYKMPNFSPLEELINTGRSLGMMDIKAVKDAKGNIVAALAYGIYKDRLTYLFPVSNEAGKKSTAMFYLLDYLIQSHAGTLMTLDFEGSSIPGIARFFQGFGATHETYYVIKRFRPAFLVGKI